MKGLLLILAAGCVASGASAQVSTSCQTLGYITNCQSTGAPATSIPWTAAPNPDFTDQANQGVLAGLKQVQAEAAARAARVQGALLTEQLIALYVSQHRCREAVAAARDLGMNRATEVGRTCQ